MGRRGGFRFAQLGAPLFDADCDLHAEVRFADLGAFLWMRETGHARALPHAVPRQAAADAFRTHPFGVGRDSSWNVA